MKYKPDWERARNRIASFWNGETGIAWVTAPRDLAEHDRLARLDAEVRRSDPLRAWTDVAYVLETRERLFASTWYAGESFPLLFPNLGPGITAAYLDPRTEPEYRADTAWLHPWMHGPTDEFSYDEDSPWLRLTFDLTTAALDAGRDRYLVATTDLGGPVDLLASMRGTEELCLDMIDNPEAVQRSLAALRTAWLRTFARFDALIRPAYAGCVSRHLWAPGSHYPLQADFASVLSPALFERFVLPEIVDLAAHLDFVEFHLDGPGVARHLDALLTVAQIKVVQWVYGDGNPTTAHWIPMLRKIQRAGKSILISVDVSLPEGKGELQRIIEELDTRRMCLNVAGARTPEEADSIVAIFRAAGERTR